MSGKDILNAQLGRLLQFHASRIPGPVTLFSEGKTLTLHWPDGRAVVAGDIKAGAALTVDVETGVVKHRRRVRRV